MKSFITPNSLRYSKALNIRRPYALDDPVPFLVCALLFSDVLSATSPTKDSLFPSVVLIQPGEGFDRTRFGSDLEKQWALEITNARTLFLGWLRLEIATTKQTQLTRSETRVLLEELKKPPYILQSSWNVSIFRFEPPTTPIMIACGISKILKWKPPGTLHWRDNTKSRCRRYRPGTQP